MPDALAALRSSVDRLAALVAPLGDDVERPAYPRDWTIADVVSHTGSSAVIGARRLDDGLAGRDLPDGFNSQVWAEWDAKAPRAKVTDGLAADAAYTARLSSLTPEERSRVSVRMGPLEWGFDDLVRNRLSEHVLHEWDVAVALRPDAGLAPDGVAVVVDGLALIGRWTAKPVGPARTITVVTTDPERRFAVTIGAEGVDFSIAERVDDPTLVMPAEAFVRLVYGRLDPAHTPATVAGDAEALDQLRHVYPGP